MLIASVEMIDGIGAAVIAAAWMAASGNPNTGGVPGVGATVVVVVVVVESVVDVEDGSVVLVVVVLGCGGRMGRESAALIARSRLSHSFFPLGTAGTFKEPSTSVAVPREASSPEPPGAVVES